MHAANLLNKRRQQREEHQQQKATSTPPEQSRDPQHHRSIHRKTNSQTSFLDSIAAGACSTPTSSAPRIPTVYESTQQQQHQQHRSPPVIGGHKQGTHGQSIRNGSSLDGYYHADPVILYHKPERISCAHIGLGIMIIGTIVTILAGFICYLLGFGEPGVIIGCGGGIITAVGLILLCCGNRWHLDERTLGKKIPINSFQFSARSGDVESLAGSLRRTERVGDTLEVSKLPKPSLPPDPCHPQGGSGGSKSRSLFAPVLEIDMVSEPEPSGGTVETDAEELK